jgi:(p)ppGpp synthase/HD superfamily hydrolase
MEDILEKIRDFANKAHGTQTRKYSTDPYIVHPVRVMETLKKYDASRAMLAAALLHDVLEDTPVSPVEMVTFLKTLLPDDEAELTLKMVTELTDVYIKSAYPEWNRRVRKDKELDRVIKISPDAQTIKYADILDNSTEIVAHDPSFAKRYLFESRAILQKATKGNPALREEALRVINRGLSQFR